MFTLGDQAPLEEDVAELLVGLLFGASVLNGGDIGGGEDSLCVKYFHEGIGR